MAGSSLARNKLVSGTTDDIRQRSRFTPVTIACGSRLAAVCVPTNPTRCVVHIPAARPLPQMSPSARTTLPLDSSTVKKSPGN